mmetsp:Transcript_31981/g.80456  ORF Transcript_31981/g.80456 Transcript_31981/m.80456 type:complete len:315 (-) Transcript_31981:2-946(-)
MRRLLKQTRCDLVCFVAVCDGLHEASRFERRHRRVAVQLDASLVCLKPRFVDLERLGILPCFESRIALLAFPVSSLALCHLAGVSLVDVRLHSFERRVVRHVPHPWVGFIVGGGPQVPGAVVGGLGPACVFGWELLAILCKFETCFFAALFFSDHLLHLDFDFLLFLFGKVLVLFLLSILHFGLNAHHLPLLLLLFLADAPVHVLGAHLAAVQARDEAADVVHLVQEALGLVHVGWQRTLAIRRDLARGRAHGQRSTLWSTVLNSRLSVNDLYCLTVHTSALYDTELQASCGKAVARMRGAGARRGDGVTGATS